MSKIERGQFSTLLRRYLGMAGVSDVVDELAPEISGVFVLEQERPEWEFLKGARLLGHAGSVPAQAASNSAVRYRNPANSGMIAIFTHAMTGGVLGSLHTMTHGAIATDQATINGYGIRDGRQTPIGGAMIVSSGYAAPGGNAIGGIILPANTSLQMLFPSAVVVVPGWALNISMSTPNSDLYTNVHWLEKRLDDLER
jgi:hypothetical protein